jgi:hypothetical protein
MCKRSAILLLVALAYPAWAGVDSRIAAIEREVAQIEKDTAGFAQKRDEHCDGENCTGSISFFDGENRLRKVIEQLNQPNAPSRMTARYYTLQCRLILVRVAPADAEKVRDPRSVEKYYFSKGRLIRAEFGGDAQAFSKEQLAYYERVERVEPPICH